MRARLYDAILRRYPGYTVRTLGDEDAGELLPMIDLLEKAEAERG